MLVYEKSQPVYKGKNKKRSNVESYREIMLVSVVGKIMEKMFAHKIEIQIKDLLPFNIFGYVKGKGTEDAIELIYGVNRRSKEGCKKL